MRRPKRGQAAPTKLVTNSMRSCFLECRRKFWWQFEKKLKSNMPYMPFVIGGEFHSAMERWYGKMKQPKVHSKLDIAMKEYQKMLLPPHLLEKIAIAHGALRGMLAAYFKKYSSDYRHWKIVAIEHVFSNSLGFNGWEAGGKNDLVVRENRKLWVVEHKTVGDLTVDYVERLPLDNQIHQYHRGATRDFGPIEGVIYNVVMKSRLRQKKDEGFPQFCKRVEEQYQLDPSKYFFRVRLRLPAWSLERFDQEMRVCCDEIDHARARGVRAFYMNTGACYSRGACPYVPLCSTPNPEEAMNMYRVDSTPHPELED